MTAFNVKFVFVCDQCQAKIETEEMGLFTDNFKRAGQAIKEQGWQIKYGHPYKHYCPKCIRPSVKPFIELNEGSNDYLND